MSEKIHSQEFTVDGTPTVRIGNIRGSVTVSPGPDGQVSITAVERGSDDRTRVEIGQEADGSIYARTRYENTGFVSGLRGDRPNEVDYTVTVPAQADLTVKCVSADTDAQGISGDIRLKSVSGEVRTAGLSGDLHLETVSGRITGDRLSGPIVLRTVSGDASLTGSDLPSLRATSVSGSLELETPIGGGPYEIRTVSGTVRVRTADRPSGRVHFKSVSGSAYDGSGRLRPSGGSSRPGSKKALYVLSEDGPDIYFSSVSGSLKLLTEEGAAPGPVVIEKTGPGRMEILEKIASGEMSVDEAVEEMGG